MLLPIINMELPGARESQHLLKVPVECDTFSIFVHCMEGIVGMIIFCCIHNVTTSHSLLTLVSLNRDFLGQPLNCD